jgi:integrase
MPKLIHRNPKYRKHASGQAVVCLGGTSVYLGVHGSPQSRKEYSRLIAEWNSNGRNSPTKTEYSIAELIAAYWKHAEEYFAVAEGKSDGELQSIRMALRAMKGLYADADVKDFGPLSLRAVRDAMVKLGWSRRYVNGQVNRLRRVFAWGVEHEMVPPNVWLALKSVAALKEGKCDAHENAPINAVDDRHVEAVLPWLNRHVRAMVALQRLTGARPGEIINMRHCEISKGNPELWEFRPTEHKTKYAGHDRTIYLNADSQKVLLPFLKDDDAAYVFRPIDAEAERREAASKARKTPLSCGNRPGTNRMRKPRREPGEHYTTTSYYQAITRACDQADRFAKGGVVIGNDERIIPRWHPHQIRHTVGTQLRAKYGLEAAQVILGHKTLAATQIYASKNVEKAKQIMLEGAVK